MYTYLTLLVVFLLIPLIVFWIFFWKTFLQYKKIFLFTVMSTFLFGAPWDLLSVRTGLWRYDSSPTLGVWFFGGPSTGLPFEEFIIFNTLCPLFISTIVIIAWKYLKKYVW